jgi:Protein of unknown function (DUF2924)
MLAILAETPRFCAGAHTVLVREDGFEYDGRRYRSLTVIAEQITGAHWSGPRFFGLSAGGSWIRTIGPPR